MTHMVVIDVPFVMEGTFFVPGRLRAYAPPEKIFAAGCGGRAAAGPSGRDFIWATTSRT